MKMRWRDLDPGRYWPLLPLILPILLSNPDIGTNRVWVKPIMWVGVVLSGLYGLHRTANEQDERQENYATRAADLFEEFAHRQGDRIIENVYYALASEREEAAVRDRESARRDKDAEGNEVATLREEIRTLEEEGAESAERDKWPGSLKNAQELVNRWKRAIKALECINEQRDQIVKQSVSRLLADSDCSIKKDLHFIASCSQEIEAILKCCAYARLIDSVSSLDAGLMPGLRERFQALDISVETVIKSIHGLKEDIGDLAGKDAQAEIAVFLDYISESLESEASA